MRWLHMSIHTHHKETVVTQTSGSDKSISIFQLANYFSYTINHNTYVQNEDIQIFKCQIQMSKALRANSDYNKP